MGGKKKGKRGKKGGRKEDDKEALECRFEQQEELTALSAIFQDDFKLISEEPFIEYAITIYPHTVTDGSVQDHVAVDLQVRYVSNYPNRPPKLRVIPKGGLDDAEVHHLQDMLAEQAASIAREGRVMVFNLCEAAQEFLSTHSHGPALSLWDQMQERAIGEVEAEQPSTSFSGGGAYRDGFDEYHDSVDVGLFTDWWADGEIHWEGKAVQAAGEGPPEKRPVSGGAGRRLREPHVAKHEAEKTKVTIRAGKAPLPVKPKPKVAHPAHKKEEDERGKKVGAGHARRMSWGFGSEPEGSDTQEGASRPLQMVASRAGRSSVTELLQNVRNGLMRVGNVVRQTMLPEWSRGGGSPRQLEAEDASDGSDGEARAEEPASGPQNPSLRKQLQKLQDAAATQAIRKDLLLGHMLRLLTSPRGPVPHALPALTAQMARIGMLPGWARDLVAHQPALFDKAFRSMFGKAAREAEARCEPSTRWAVTKFWRGAVEQADLDGNEEGAGTSRYLADFQEVSMLGRGGFGSVMLCINKLDGRRYAIKKIKLRSNSPLVNSKILREVATLSRLQHQNVVRYYQAWFETGVGNLVGVVDGTSDDPGDSNGDWLTTGGTATLAGGPSVESGESSSVTGEGGPGGGHTQHLYIQMEYCPRTLRQVLDSYGSGPVNADVTWRIFRQIVEGLVHIHGNHTIHRDLTPNNIFADPRGDIKIGDFGLAKFTDLEQSDGSGQVAEDEEASTPKPAAARPDSLEGTGQVGTYLYTAPEIEQGWPKIDEKCDLYSLGIVLFELWHPFSTAMERAVLLNEVKQKGVLPPPWAETHPEQAALVRWLVAPNPADRPSALEVLRSDLLPPRMEDEALNDVLRTLHSGGDTAVCSQIMGAIFDDERLAAQAEGLQGGLERPMLMEKGPEAEAALRVMKEVFHRHGAGETETGTMDMVEDPGRCHRQAVRLADAGGNVLALRHETRLPLATYVAASQLSSLRRYEIARVYRRGVGRSAPRELLQGDFDIIGGSSRPESRTLAEAEAIKVALEVVAELVPLEPSSAGGAGALGGPSGLFCEVRLNHRDLLSTVWSWAGVPMADRQSVAQLLAIMGTWPPRAAARKSQWPLIRRQLLQGLRLPEAVVDRLQTVERRLSGQADEALPRLRGALPPSRATLAALDELGSLLQHLRVWGIEEHVTIDALMSPHDDFYSGAIFQVHLCRTEPHARGEGLAGPQGEGSARGGQRGGHATHPAACVAVGGRYDGLLRRLWPESSSFSAPGAVGLSIGVQKLVAAASSGGSPPLKVLVCSRGGGGLLRERMQVAAELWAGNLHAQFLAAAAPSLTEQYEYAHEHGIKWLVIITEEKLSAADSVKVRNLDARTEEEVPRADLVKHFSEPHIRKRAFQSKHAN